MNEVYFELTMLTRLLPMTDAGHSVASRLIIRVMLFLYVTLDESNGLWINVAEDCPDLAKKHL